MMSHLPRSFIPPGGTRKRKEREPLYFSSPPPPTTATTEAAGLVSSNRLLAGYLAHEFLTKGTLLGQKFDPARVEAVPLASSTSSVESSREARNTRKDHHSYAEVASIVKADGTHIPGIVNPSQLSRWIQM